MDHVELDPGVGPRLEQFVAQGGEVYGRGRDARAQRTEHLLEPGPVHGPPVIGVHEGQVPPLGPLVEVRDAGGGELQHGLTERVDAMPWGATRSANGRSPRPSGNPAPARPTRTRARPGRTPARDRSSPCAPWPPGSPSPCTRPCARSKAPLARSSLVERARPRPASGTGGTRRSGRGRRARPRDPAAAASADASAGPPRCHSSGISESTLIRARTSSLRLVSWVEVASIACGHRARRSAFCAWKAAGDSPKRARVAAHLVERHQPVVEVERRVLDALGHHRAGHLLEAQHEAQARAPLGLGELLRGPQQERVAQEVEHRRAQLPGCGGAPRPPPRSTKARSRALDLARRVVVYVRYTGRQAISSRMARVEIVQREVARAPVALGEPVELMASALISLAIAVCMISRLPSQITSAKSARRPDEAAVELRSAAARSPRSTNSPLTEARKS